MTPKRPLVRRALVAVALVAVVAVGVRVALGETKGQHLGVLPACAVGHRPLRLPRTLASFPLPKGTVVGGRGTTYGYTLLTGRVPGGLSRVRAFFVSQLPRSGWKLGAGDAELTEAESFFTGHGGVGHFKVHALPNCDGALSLRLTFALRKAP